MNKNISTILLAIAVAILYVLHFVDCKTTCPAVAKTNTETPFALQPDSSIANFPVAYVNLDSLLFSYTLYNELKQAHEAKYQSSEAHYKKEAETLQKDIYQFQENAQKGLMTRADAQIQEKELQRRQQELMQLEQSLSEDLMRKEEQMQKRIYDSIQVVLNDFNADKRFRLILNNAFGNSLLSADNALNITDTILVLLNDKHKAE